MVPVLYLCVRFQCALNGSTSIAVEWNQCSWLVVHCGVIRWLLAYGLSVISLTSVLCTIGRYDDMTRWNEVIVL